MKHILKAGQPQEYREWRKQMKDHENERYPVPDPPRKELINALLDEQGFLCGYTMQRIDTGNCHIEHVKPESVCRAEKKGSDLDYENMIACFPKKTEKNKTEFIYGAIYKQNWWEEDGDKFVSPLNPKCEVSFSFNLKGEIIPLDEKAVKTIEVLRLDHKSLTEDRKRNIQEFIYGSNGSSPLSSNKAIQALELIVQRSESGYFTPFCIAIKCALREYIKLQEKIAAKKKFAVQVGKK